MKKYYWLKLDRNFFKRHDIQIVESMPNGKDYVLFYLKLLVESIDHEGELRFNDTIPYDEKMLSVITGTNIDIVRAAIQVFQNLKLMETFDNGTIYLKEITKMLGESSSTHRVQAYREKVKQTLIARNVTETLHETQLEKEIEIDKEQDKETDKKKKAPVSKVFIAPSLDDIKAYCIERKNSIDPQVFYDYFTVGKWIDSQGNPVRNWKQKMVTWEKHQTVAPDRKVAHEPEWLDAYIKDLTKMEG